MCPAGGMSFPPLFDLQQFCAETRLNGVPRFFSRGQAMGVAPVVAR